MNNNMNISLNMLRAVVIECSHLNDSQLSQTGQTLHHLISLSNQLMANTNTNIRFTHFMLELIDLTSTQIIPILFIKSNQFLTQYLDKLLKLKQFRSHCHSNEMSFTSKSICAQNLHKNMELTIRRILNDHKEEQINCIEINYISGRHEKDVIQDICHVLQKLEFTQNTSQSRLSMVNILCISSDSLEPNRIESKSRPITCSTSSTTFADLKIPEELEGLIETQTINDNSLWIEGFFKVWLHDSNFESEKIQISLGNNNTDHELIIRCDLKEAILDLNLIPVIKRPEFDWCRTQTIPPSILPNDNRTKTIDKLKIVSLVLGVGLCDSVVFGIPYVLSPTRCHNLSFNELELNVQHFHALIQVMNEKKAVAILELKRESSPNYYYVLLTSPDNKALIMKSVAAKELVLPLSRDSVDKYLSITPTQQIVSSVRQQLSQFSFADLYNPLYVKSNLYDFI